MTHCGSMKLWCSQSTLNLTLAWWMKSRAALRCSWRPVVAPRWNLRVVDGRREDGIVCFSTLSLSSGVRLNFISRFSICLNFFCSFLTSPIWRSRDSWKGARVQSQTARDVQTSAWDWFDVRVATSPFNWQSGRPLSDIWMDQAATPVCVPLSRRVAGCWQCAWGVLLSLQRHHVDTEAVANWHYIVWFHHHSPHYVKCLEWCYLLHMCANH